MEDFVFITRTDFENCYNNLIKIERERPSYREHIYIPNEVALNSFLLVIDLENGRECGVRYAYDMNKREVVCAFETKQGKVKLIGRNIRVDDNGVAYEIGVDSNELQNLIFALNVMKSGYSPKKMQEQILRCFFALNFYLKNLPTTYTTTTEKVSETYVENKKGDKRYKTRIKLVRHINMSVKPLSTNKIKHIIKCLCWGVRGHERHYKDGRVVWIKPFRKGKERNNENAYVPKEYSL